MGANPALRNRVSTSSTSAPLTITVGAICRNPSVRSARVCRISAIAASDPSRMP
jgi:hypothetical protein